MCPKRKEVLNVTMDFLLTVKEKLVQFLKTEVEEAPYGYFSSSVPYNLRKKIHKDSDILPSFVYCSRSRSSHFLLVKLTNFTSIARKDKRLSLTERIFNLTNSSPHEDEYGVSITEKEYELVKMLIGEVGNLENEKKTVPPVRLNTDLVYNFTSSLYEARRNSDGDIVENFELPYFYAEKLIKEIDKVSSNKNV